MAVRLVVRGPSGSDAKADIAFEFDQQRVVIGRGTGVDVRLPKGTVSDHHATIRVESHGVVIVDDSSTNGTFVEGSRLVPRRAKLLRDGDTIRISTFVLTYHASALPVTSPPSVERTATLARRMLRELLDPSGFATQPVELLVTAGPNEGQRFRLPEAPARLVVGRSETAEFALTDAETSREHVEIVRDAEGTLIRDLDSKNGIRINEKPMREKRLRDRDEIALGNTVLTFVDPADAAMRNLEGIPDEKLDETPEPPPPAATSAPAAIPESPPSAPTHEDAAVRKAPLKKKSSPGFRSDIFVYVFAGTVLLVSAIALFVLLRAR